MVRKSETARRSGRDDTRETLCEEATAGAAYGSRAWTCMPSPMASLATVIPTARFSTLCNKRA